MPQPPFKSAEEFASGPKIATDETLFDSGKRMILIPQQHHRTLRGNPCMVSRILCAEDLLFFREIGVRMLEQTH